MTWLIRWQHSSCRDCTYYTVCCMVRSSWWMTGCVYQLVAFVWFFTWGLLINTWLIETSLSRKTSLTSKSLTMQRLNHPLDSSLFFFFPISRRCWRSVPTWRLDSWFLGIHPPWKAWVCCLARRVFSDKDGSKKSLRKMEHLDKYDKWDVLRINLLYLLWNGMITINMVDRCW